MGSHFAEKNPEDTLNLMEGEIWLFSHNECFLHHICHLSIVNFFQIVKRISVLYVVHRFHNVWFLCCIQSLRNGPNSFGPNCSCTPCDSICVIPDLSVQYVNLEGLANQQSHETQGFTSRSLVVRRGAPFRVTLDLKGRPFNPQTDTLIFKALLGTEPSVWFGLVTFSQCDMTLTTWRGQVTKPESGDGITCASAVSSTVLKDLKQPDDPSRACLLNQATLTPCRLSYRSSPSVLSRHLLQGGLSLWMGGLFQPGGPQSPCPLCVPLHPCLSRCGPVQSAAACAHPDLPEGIHGGTPHPAL